MAYKFISKSNPDHPLSVKIYKNITPGSQNPFVAFSPFIESFKHTLTPKIAEAQIGLFAATTYFQSGVAKNSYQITLALPAIDGASAKSNYNKVMKLKRLADPQISQLAKSAGQVRLAMGNLIPPESQVGYITSVDETFELDSGWAGTFPKLIRVSFTFAVDEVYRAAAGFRTEPEDSPDVIKKQDQNVGDKTGTADSTAEQAKRAAANKSTKAKENLKKGVGKPPKPCP